MKKLFLTIAISFMALAANAQIIIGGNIGFGMTNGNTVTTTTIGGTETTVTVDNPSTSNFYIMPKIGFGINEKMSAGIILGYSTTTATRFLNAAPIGATNYEGWRKVTNNSINITPYFRYNAASLNNFTLFCEAALPIAISPETAIKNYESYDLAGNHVETNVDNKGAKQTSFGITVTPGLNYALNSHLSMDIYFNAIGLGYITTKTTTVNETPAAKVVDVDTDNDFGFNVRTLPAAVTFGINYAF